jgi:hypothetical protein
MICLNPHCVTAFCSGCTDGPAPAALVHLFSQGRYATALCGASNADDGDAPASEVLAEVTCADCRRLAAAEKAVQS